MLEICALICATTVSCTFLVGFFMGRPSGYEGYLSSKEQKRVRRHQLEIAKVRAIEAHIQDSE